MKTDRHTAADWDPVSAIVYGPQELKKPSGEAYSGPPVQLFKTRVKSIGLWAQTKTNQEHAQSQTSQYLDVRSEGLGDKLTSDMFIVHRKTRYDIVGRLNSDYREGSTRYQVQVTHDYTFSQ